VARIGRIAAGGMTSFKALTCRLPTGRITVGCEETLGRNTGKVGDT